MSKKKIDVMEKERTAFVSGCEKNGISKGEAVREAVQQWLEHQT